MHSVEIIRIPARLSHLGIDELYYELESDDWETRARHLQERRWYHMRAAMYALRHQGSHRKEVA